jgi:poly-D-alanine transfer protein DltD
MNIIGYIMSKPCEEDCTKKERSLLLKKRGKEEITREKFGEKKKYYNQKIVQKRIKRGRNIRKYKN